ncbi:protein FAM214B [Gopherus evgoodei]|uniref:Atos homolog protein B n=1 Tax=Gopherus evgoodei TaxID=1825980 RepID=A0A8C4WDU2_9SAUR|nr:protein FAM214B [Gopherus evgoodei]XP_030422807.1 protein FAM214B [Gopherus evgoodei]XP_030422808.1 protein FAM214B [Gopherus evgoodei]XP_030422809.1 protein FAM214B [Gopherus evgoodei]XP_030422810.1 protein FAM214B [Gopherus evgoodei]
MRHIHAEASLPQEHGTDSGLSRPGSQVALEPAPEHCPRRSIVMGYNKTEIKRQKVYQVSIFSHLSSSSEPAVQRAEGGRQAIKRGYLEQWAPEAGRDPKRTHWGSPGAEARQDGVPGELHPGQDSPDDDAVEDGLLVEELSLCGSAQHFSHSGLRVVEHRCEGSPGRAGAREGSPRACREDRSWEAASSWPQHTACSTLHMRDSSPAQLEDGPLASPRACGSVGGRELPRLAGAREQPAEGNGPQREERASSQNILDIDLHNIAQKSWTASGGRGEEQPGGSPAHSNGAGREEEQLTGHKEPSTPRMAPDSESNGLGSLEKTPCVGSRLLGASGGNCAAKRKLLPSGEGVADSCSEDESVVPVRKKRPPLCHPILTACRSTDAKGAPFWNHLLPGAKSSAGGTAVGRRLKSGLRLKSRHLRSSLRKGPVRTRPSAAAWATTSFSHALLGNFEESILKGRFAPSGRIEGFTAEIGASGSYCPQHATLPVDVTYFDISEHSAPSPFLGVIDLEALGKKGYSVPKAGTIQVTLFNPNKTVVKMFLVTYDFQDMPANHMTFLRHRIFLVPVGEEGPGETPSDPACASPPRRVLCYLMHLRFHSSKSGKIYLHDDIRLLFSRKSIEVDSGIPYELKSFTEMPRNPCYSPRG